MRLERNMDYRILWDNNMLLDLFLLRTEENPYILEIEEIFSENKIPIYLSSSQLHNLKYIFGKYLKDNKISIDPNVILKKFIDTHIVKVLKTPSYIDISKWCNNVDIEDELIKLTAETFDLYVLTRDNNFLEILKDRGIHPKNLNEFLKKNMDKTIPMLDLTKETLYSYNDIEINIDKVIKESTFILGPEVKELEDKIAQYIGVKHCIGCSSGTEALVLSLRALAIKIKGQEYFDKNEKIITTPFTFTATGDAILRAGATPVFVDIDLNTYNIDPKKIREYLNRSKNVVGIIPVHLYGHPANMDEIMKIAREYNLFVVEDVAQAFGSMWKDKKLGSFGTTGCFSFFPSKNLGGFGDGGMVSTNDGEIAEIIRMLIKHGGKDKYNVEHIGYNARLDTLQASILLAKFKYVDEFNERRRRIAEFYNKELKNIKEIVLPKEEVNSYHVYHQYTIRVKNGKRDKLKKFLQEKGISSMVYYPFLLKDMKVFSDRCEVYGNLKRAEEATKEVLSLPIEPLLKEEDILKVTNTIKEFFKKNK